MNSFPPRESSPLSAAPSSPVYPSTPTPLSYVRGRSPLGSPTPLPADVCSSSPLSSPTPLPASALPSPSGYSSDLIWSSPVVGTAAEKSAIRVAKGRRNREQKLNARAVEKEALLVEEEEARRNRAQETFHDCLELLRSRGLTFGDLCMYCFNPESGEGTVRWHEFAATRGRITQLLDWWRHATSPSVRDEVNDWAMDNVCERVGKAARHITRLGVLRTFNKVVDDSFVSSFGFDKLYKLFSKEGGVIVRVFEAVSKSASRADNFSDARKTRGNWVVASAISACLREHNQSNNLSQRMFGLYLYASGVQRQIFTVLSHLGISTSYASLVRNEKLPEKGPVLEAEAASSTTPTSSAPAQPPLDSATGSTPSTEQLPAGPSSDFQSASRRRLGTLRLLSNGVCAKARTVASVGIFGEVYDNINFQNRTAEQIIGRHDNQENGTCVTIFKLWAARLEDLQTSALQAAFDAAPPLRMEDIIHNQAEERLFRQCLIHVIIRIIAKFAGQEELQALQKDVDAKQPRSSFCITPHKTEIHPLGAFDIDESSITGNIEADEAVVNALELRTRVTRFWQRVRIVAGDQLSLARLRAIEGIRAGQESEYEGFHWGIWMPGLFHTKMADIHGFFVTHFGKADAGITNPACLAFHNAALTRLPITLSSLPNFRTCRDLVFVSLYARVLHCLLLVSGKASLEEYATSQDLNWAYVYKHAEQIYDTFVDTCVVAELRDDRDFAGGRGKGEGDMVYENAILFLRDALISREFTDAVKAGDSGRVILVLKIWALSFRGNGRTKYAYEMLHLIHHIEAVWPEEMKKIVLNNWLVNTTGGQLRFLEIDLLQEHLNYWIKVFYKAHGSNMSWDWLAMIAPCLNVLRSLAKSMNSILGSKQGSRHSEVNLGNDISTLMASLASHKVYQIIKGREVDSDEEIVVDVVSVGLVSLTAGAGSPLAEYNTAFARLQQRRRMVPVDVGDTERPITPTCSPSSSPELQPPSPLVSPVIPNIPLPAASASTAVPCTEGSNLGDSEPLEYEEGNGELSQILEDIHNGVRDETLLLTSAEDVDLELDDDLDADGDSDDESDLEDVLDDDVSDYE